MEKFTGIFQHSTSNIDRDYFQLAVQEGAPIYRERVYCYELYHQMRCLWPDNQEIPFRLNGEINKSGHPVLKRLEMGLPTPDFLVHVPGTMDHNYAVIEVKSLRARLDGIQKDLITLSEFVRVAGYTRAIYLIYGYEIGHDLISTIRDSAATVGASDAIELWAHTSPGHPATLIGALS